VNALKLLKCLGGLVALFATTQALSHGEVGGEWRALPEQSSDVQRTVQVQCSPLGSQIVVEYRGIEPLEILAADGRAFLRISRTGVLANWDHPAWFRSQVAGKRPLPPWTTDAEQVDDWRSVSRAPYWAWFDPRLSRGEHGNSWEIPARLGIKSAPIRGTFVALSAPLYRQVPMLDRQFLPADNSWSARIIPDVEPALRLAYRGDQSIIVLDEEGEPMLRFSPKGVEARVASSGWRRLARMPHTADGEWVTISSQPAYTWPDTRLANEGEDRWYIPLLSGQGSSESNGIGGSWIRLEVSRIDAPQ
jgi:hypothetical protein